ncbi:MAG TPA: metallophosphoesterase [Chloroflexia bacterium]|nr:metallophosphoesterase [Chloroflexia bacterium]
MAQALRNNRPHYRAGIRRRVGALLVLLLAGGAPWLNGPLSPGSAAGALLGGVGFDSVTAAPVAAQPVAASRSADPGERFFPETGQVVSGPFRAYWESHGGLAQQGYPISDVRSERSPTDGLEYRVQYFERAVFEQHPANAPPFDVLLSLLGVFEYQQRYPNGAPGQVANTGPGSVAFAETGHRLGGAFHAYWESHGGLAQQGYPISDEFTEMSRLDGKSYTVQYFQRAVMEKHPENAPPFDVLLAQLGTFAYQARPAPPVTPVGTPAPTSVAPGDPILVGAGDIAGCGEPGAEATARLLDGIPGTVFAAGDTVYDAGSPAEFANCYDATWGRHKARTRPAVGNHEYGTPNADGYFAYFGAASAPPLGYYSYELGAWHIVVINSMCGQIGGCGPGSPQELWLRADLASHPARCTLAYWHHPRFSSGAHGSIVAMQPIWQALYDAGAEVVLSGHDHHYERFAPQDATGRLDQDRGIREFVVGTGGKSHYPIGPPIPNSEVHTGSTYGVLKLTLHAGSFDWQFVPEAGRAFTDRGTGVCH